jgi:hypothetical protein
MGHHHYKTLPSYCFWQHAVARVEGYEIDAATSVPFTIGPGERVAAAGSCFAQHLTRHLALNGVGPYITEDAHPIAPPDLAREYGYGVFTARYGNVYTTRQLVQLFKRAHGMFRPSEDIWLNEDGRFVDPFRPQVHPGGFLTKEAYFADRRRHFAAVREAFSSMDVLVYTFGLTECWTHREDGAAYPLCPGVAGGVFDPEKYLLVNLDVDDVVREMTEFIDLVRASNPKAKVIFTVSPVSMNATALDRHVLVSNSFTKSVLRVACDMLVRRCTGVAYFPSYEMVTGPHARGRYYAEDRRHVTEEGVALVMRSFVEHFVPGKPQPAGEGTNVDSADAARHREHMNAMSEVVDALCDEEAIGSA